MNRKIADQDQNKVSEQSQLLLNFGQINLQAKNENPEEDSQEIDIEFEQKTELNYFESRKFNEEL